LGPEKHIRRVGSHTINNKALIVNPGESLPLGNAIKIKVKNTNATQKGSFSVDGTSLVLDPTQTVEVNLMVEDDNLVNSDKTALNVTILPHS